MKRQNHSRRRFLKQTLIAGIAPLWLPRLSWAANTSPNSRITLAFIGMGKQNRYLLNGFLARKDTQVLAVCDVDATRRADAKQMVESHYARQTSAGGGNACAAYGDFRELLARRDVDGVVIATPDHWHALIAIAAARAGKDIYCEKPMSHSVEEGRAMVNAVRKNERVFQVGSMQRSSREFRTACELVRNGVLGKIAKVEVAVGGPARPCDLPEEAMEPGLNWDGWLGPAPQRPYNSVLSPRGVHDHFPAWRNYREYGGGGVTDWGAHHLDIAHWALGFDGSGPVEIIPANRPDAESGVKLRYATGVEIQHVSGNGVTFFGDHGRLYVNRGKFELWMGNELKASEIGDCNQMLAEFLPANAVRLYNSPHHLQDWLDCMRSRQRPICDVQIGESTATACNLINLAYYHGQLMKWDPQTETFRDGTGDPRWLKYDYRAPWKLS